MKVNSKEFKKLQDEWYAKAAQAGFKDIEKRNGDLRRPSAQLFHKNRNNTNRYDYFRLLEQYRVNGHRSFRKFTQEQRACFVLHSKGYSLREISAMFKSGSGRYKKLGFSGSYVTIKRAIDPVIDECMRWHKESPAGLLHPGNQDIIAEEVLIREREGHYDTGFVSFEERQQQGARKLSS